jgi:hypothetical protein
MTKRKRTNNTITKRNRTNNTITKRQKTNNTITKNKGSRTAIDWDYDELLFHVQIVTQVIYFLPLKKK